MAALKEYGDAFFAFVHTFAGRSAERVVPLVRQALAVRSVADFGCGYDAWLRVWRESGASIADFDGPHVDPDRLLIPRETFTAADLGRPLDLRRRFDLVQDLEVAEHHINERPLAYWRGVFANHGYRAVDCVRPAVAGNAAVQRWYNATQSSMSTMPGRSSSRRQRRTLLFPTIKL